MNTRATHAIRLILGAIAAGGIALCLWATDRFNTGFDDLLHKGYDNPDASNTVGNAVIVAPAYRQFPSIDIANAASIVAALALMLALCWQGGRTFRLPHRAALIIGLPLSFALFLQGLQVNGDITSLDHLAVGLLRFDEDSWVPIVSAFMLMAPLLCLLWVFSWIHYARTIERTQPMKLNALLVLITLASAWFGGSTLLSAMTSDARYDTTSYHSVLGLGPFLFYIWLCVCLILGRAAAFTTPRKV